MRILGVILLCLGVNLSDQRSTESDDSYVAAVLEYAFENNATINLDNYIKFIQDAATQNADIIVFPEMTLTRGSYIEVPIKGLLLNNPIPALAPQLYHPILVDLSKAALDYQIYVVVNINEVMNCTNNDNEEYCPESKIYYFNTNVVLDRNGAVIDRYRKINLFGEPGNTPALNPDLGLFTTDFGVTFGHFICFDLMFQIPAIQVVQKNNITDVIFTTMWFSELPYLTAVEIQEAYAYSLGINFLASGANNVRVGSAGSGIYSGKAGALISIMPGVPTTRLLVTKVPKVPGNITDFPGPIHGSPADADSLYLKKDPSIPSHVTSLLQEGFQTVSLSNNGVSCSLKVNLTYGAAEPIYSFRALVHDSTNNYAHNILGTAACAIIACKGDSVKDCPYKYKDTDPGIMISSLEIEIITYKDRYNKSLKCNDSMSFVNSIKTDNIPVNPANFTFSDYVTDKNLKIGLKKMSVKLNSQENVVAFGLWSRLYARDILRKDNVNFIFGDESNLIQNELSPNHYYYRATAFDGVRTFDGVATGGNQLCSIIACSGTDVTTCGERFTIYEENNTATFHELSITASVPAPVNDLTLNADDSFFVPISLGVTTLPLSPEEYTIASTIEGDRKIFTMSLINHSAEIYSLGVWGRRYNRDEEEATAPSSNHLDTATDASISHFLGYTLLTVLFLIILR